MASNQNNMKERENVATQRTLGSLGVLPRSDINLATESHTANHRSRGPSNAQPVDEFDKEPVGLAVASAQPSVAYPPVKYKTMRTLVMAVLVSIGGMIFGYGGIGQIGGFLAMPDYRVRFSDEFDDDKGERKFSEVRAGTIVGMVWARC
jgi:hypothetical protein